MKKSIAMLTGGIILPALLLSGCAGLTTGTGTETETSVSEEVVVAEEETKPAENIVGEAEPEVVDEKPHLDGEWLQKAHEYYVSKVPEEDRVLELYADGVRGEADFHADFNNKVYFSYYNEGMSMSLEIDPHTEKANIDIDFQYDENRYYVNGTPVEIDGIEAYIDSMIEGKAKFEDVYDDSAWVQEPDKVRNDIEVCYSRLIALSDKGFSEINTTLEDYGIDLGDKYRNNDPTRVTSNEVYVVNDHEFENGVCKECGMTWTKYMNRTLAAFELEEVADDAEYTDWYSTYGQGSRAFGGWEYVQYSSSDIYETEITFYKPGDIGRRCTIYIDQDKKGEGTVYMIYDLAESYIPVDVGVVTGKVSYRCDIYTDLGELDKVFASKEAFAEAGQSSLIMRSQDNSEITPIWEEMSDDEARKLFEDDGCDYYTRDEFTDVAWEDLQIMLPALDRGMVWFDTNLKDAGLNYEQ